MKKIILIAGGTLFIFIGSVWWSNSLSGGDADIIARRGIHWHPSIEIYVDGKSVLIPENMGLTGVESPIHTHDDTPLVHLEFSGVVHKKDITLNQFFKVWHKSIDSFGKKVAMTVNGVPNTELGDYVMHDKDKIVLRYTSENAPTASSTVSTTIEENIQ